MIGIKWMDWILRYLNIIAQVLISPACELSCTNTMMLLTCLMNFVDNSRVIWTADFLWDKNMLVEEVSRRLAIQSHESRIRAISVWGFARGMDIQDGHLSLLWDGDRYWLKRKINAYLTMNCEILKICL